MPAVVDERVTLGSTGLSVSPICYGSWQASPSFWGPQPDEDIKAAMRRAFDVGINFFDTADAYGDGLAERLMGEALAEIPRDQLIIATKAYWHFHEDGRRYPDLSRDYILRACDNSLKRLNMDYIDLYQCHAWDPLIRMDETIEALDRLVEQGKVRHYGVSNWKVEQLRLGLALGGRFATHQPHYNLLERSIENDLLPFCQQQNIGTLVFSPLQRGLLSGKYKGDETFEEGRAKHPDFQGERFKLICERMQQINEMAAGYGAATVPFMLALTLMHPGVDVVIAGAKNPSHIEQAAEATALEISREDYFKARSILNV